MLLPETTDPVKLICKGIKVAILGLPRMIPGLILWFGVRMIPGLIVWFGVRMIPGLIMWFGRGAIPGLIMCLGF